MTRAFAVRPGSCDDWIVKRFILEFCTGLVLTLVSMANAWALEKEVSVLKGDPSNQQVHLSIGNAHYPSLPTGDFQHAILLSLRSATSTSGVSEMLAQLQFMSFGKNSPESESIWKVTGPALWEKLENSPSVILLTRDDLLRGRRARSVDRQKKVSLQNKNQQAIENFYLGHQEQSYLRVIQAAPIAIVHQERISDPVDYVLGDFDEWNAVDDKLQAAPIYRGPPSDEFAEKKRQEIFEQIVARQISNAIEQPAQLPLSDLSESVPNGYTDIETREGVQ